MILHIRFVGLKFNVSTSIFQGDLRIVISMPRPVNKEEKMLSNRQMSVEIIESGCKYLCPII